VFSLQWKDASKLASNWYQLLMYLIYTAIMSDYIICILTLIPKMSNKGSHALNIFKTEQKFEKRTNVQLYFTGD